MEDPGPASEVLDLGVLGDEPPGGPPPRRRISRRAALLTLTGAAAGAGLLAARPSHAPAPAPQPPAAVTHDRLPRPISGTARDWQLVGLGSDAVLRVDVASSAVSRTAIPPVGEGQVFVVPGRARVYVRPLGPGTGWLVRDDEPAAALATSMAGSGALLPGPDLDHLWLLEDGRDGASMVLVDADGWGSLPVRVRVPQFATTGPMTDGAGGLLFEGVGGMYRITPAGRLTVTEAIVLAVGHGDLLTLGRGGDGRWRSMLQLRSGRSQALPIPIGPQLPHGVLAPDASSVVLYAVDEQRRTSLVLVDLPEGGQRTVQVDVTGVAGDGTVVWSPDARRLFCLDTDGLVRVVDPSSGAVADTLDLPPLRQLAVRAG